jgi:hypothetical protein
MVVQDSSAQNSFYLFQSNDLELDGLLIKKLNVEFDFDSLNIDITKFNKKSCESKDFVSSLNQSFVNSEPKDIRIRIELLSCYTHFQFGGFWNSVFEVNYHILDEAGNVIRTKYSLVEDSAYNWNGFRTAKKLQNSVIKNSFIVNEDFFKN